MFFHPEISGTLAEFRLKFVFFRCVYVAKVETQSCDSFVGGGGGGLFTLKEEEGQSKV